MAEGSRQLGRGETGTVLWTIKFFHVFSAVCGLIFAVLMFFQREAIVLTYSGDTTYAGFGALVEETWPIFVAYQPVGGRDAAPLTAPHPSYATELDPRAYAPAVCNTTHADCTPPLVPPRLAHRCTRSWPSWARSS